MVIMLRKTLCVIIVAMLVLGLFPLIRLNTANAQWNSTFSIINPGPDGYPAKWNASTANRGFGTSDFIFYSNETAVNSTFFMNITINNAETMKGWAIGVVYDNTTLKYVSAWRPSDHVFKPVEEMGWTIVAPSVTFEDLNETHKRLMWGCTYIMGDPEWTFNGSGVLCQIQFKIIKEVNLSTPQAVAWFTFDPEWTSVYHHPSGTEIPTLGTGYFEYNYVPPTYTLTITTTTGGTTTPTPGIHPYTEGTIVTVTAIADSGYTFDHWELDGANVGSDNPINVTMDSDHTLHAIFVDNTPPSVEITYPAEGAYISGATIWINGTITEENKGTLEPSINDTRFSLTYWDSMTGAFAFSNSTTIDDGLVSITVSFIDLAENSGLDTVSFTVDNTPPVINTPTQNPTADNVQPNQQVKITVNVTDSTSGVKNVTLFYTNDTVWHSVEMVYNSTSGLWEATIPGDAQGAQIKYTIEAYDNAENLAVNDNAGDYFTYTVIPEFQSIMLILFLMIMATITIMVSTRRKFGKRPN